MLVYPNQRYAALWRPRSAASSALCSRRARIAVAQDDQRRDPGREIAGIRRMSGKQAIRCGARSLEHAYLIDAEGIEMAEQAGAYIVPTMQMTQEDLHELQAGTLPCQAVWKF